MLLKAQAEANAESAHQNVSTQDRILNEEIDKLEKKKLTDMKELLMEYTKIQMIFHAKALEMLTIGYQELLDINTEDDLEEFRNSFTQSNFKDMRGSAKGGLNTSQSLYNTGDSFSTTSRSGTRNTSPRRTRSNENLSKGQKNNRAHGSAPHLNNNDSLNNSRSNRSTRDLSEYTDDSDDE